MFAKEKSKQYSSCFLSLSSFDNLGKLYSHILITSRFSPIINFISFNKFVLALPRTRRRSLLLFLVFHAEITKMEHDEMGFQTAPEGPILCVNNCGFFGSSANMNMCSKCYKDLISKQEQTQLVASSLENIVKGSSSGNDNESSLVDSANVLTDLVVEGEAKPVPLLNAGSSAVSVNPKSTKGPSRCSTCKKRVGLTGFICRCGNLFCGTHRYCDKHDCPFDYRSAGQEAIAKANPIIKAEKLEKI